MITIERTRETKRFLRDSPVRNAGNLRFLYPCLRQGLYAYFSRRGYTRVLMPDFVPEGIYDPFRRLGFDIRFYSVAVDLDINKEEIASLVETFKPQVFVYIHYFGIYRQSVLAKTTAVIGEETLVVEDFAHTLPSDDVPKTGGICCYSFTKLLGVAEGSLVWCADKKLLSECEYAAENKESRELKKRLNARLSMETMSSRFGFNHRAAAVIRTLFGRRAAYYPYLMDHYTEALTRVSKRWNRILDRIDFAAVTERRREIARLYCERLAPSLMLDVPEAEMTRQALMGFPILVDDRKEFHSFMSERGVFGLAFDDRWWFDGKKGTSGLYNRHYLLPMNHHYSNEKIARVISCVNDYKKRKG